MKEYYCTKQVKLKTDTYNKLKAIKDKNHYDSFDTIIKLLIDGELK